MMELGAALGPARGRRRSRAAPGASRGSPALASLFLTLLLGGDRVLLPARRARDLPAVLRIIFLTIAAAFALGAAYAVVLRAGGVSRRPRLRADRARPGHLDGHRLRHGRARRAARRRSTRSPASSARCSSGCAAPPSRRCAGIALYASLCLAFVFALDPAAARSAPRTSLDARELVYPLLVNALGIGVVALLARVPRRAPPPHRRRARSGDAARAPGRAARAARAASRRGSRTRSATRSDRSRVRSRCSASRRAVGGGQAALRESSSARPRG